MVVESPVGQAREGVDVSAASGVLATFDVRNVLNLNVDITVDTLSGTTPSVTFFLDRALPLGPSGVQKWVQIAAGVAVTAASTLAAAGATEAGVTKFAVGPGLGSAHLSSRQVRVRWATTGTGVAGTASVYLTAEHSYN